MLGEHLKAKNPDKSRGEQRPKREPRFPSLSFTIRTVPSAQELHLLMLSLVGYHHRQWTFTIPQRYKIGISRSRQRRLRDENRYKVITYARISDTTPEPTVLPPSRIAKRRPFSHATGVISSTVMSTLSPGRHISTPAGSSMLPVTSVVLK